MKFIVALLLVATAIAAPVQESIPAVPLDDSATANAAVIGKIQTANNVYGDIVTLGVNAGVGVHAGIDQNIINVILGLLNNQNNNTVSATSPDISKLQGIFN